MLRHNLPLDPMALEARFQELLTGSNYQIVDPEGLHHEFSSGMHGQKIDFDKIPSGSELFEQWVEANAVYYHWLLGSARLGKTALVGVANGTNRLVEPLAEVIGGGVMPLTTVKDPLRLDPDSYRMAGRFDPSTAIVIEDVGTTGNNAAHAALAIRQAVPDVRTVYGIISWQRQSELPRLKNAVTGYYSIIEDDKTYPTYHPDDCVHCKEGWELAPYNKSPV